MSEETEIGTHTLDSSSETIELRFRQQPKMDTLITETSIDELTLRSIDEQITQATDPILRQGEELCALLAGRNEMESTGNSEASSFRRNHQSISPSGNRHNKGVYYSGHKEILRGPQETRNIFG